MLPCAARPWPGTGGGKGRGCGAAPALLALFFPCRASCPSWLPPRSLFPCLSSPPLPWETVECWGLCMSLWCQPRGWQEGAALPLLHPRLRLLSLCACGCFVLVLEVGSNPHFHLLVWQGLSRVRPHAPSQHIPAPSLLRWEAGGFLDLLPRGGSAAALWSVMRRRSRVCLGARASRAGLANSLFVPEPQVGCHTRGAVRFCSLPGACPALRGDGVRGKDRGGGRGGFGGGSCLPSLLAGRASASSSHLRWHVLAPLLSSREVLTRNM